MWLEPKTNWVITDRFNYTDYNRIKNNIAHLRTLALKVYVDFPFTTMGTDKTGYADLPYADEFTALEKNLESIKNNTFNFDSSVFKEWHDNARTPDYTDFNRLETMCLAYYNGLQSIEKNKKRLSFRLGKNLKFKV